jgi:arylsulfatase A-like enzyme
VSLLAALGGAPHQRGPVYSQATKPGPPIERADQWGNLAKARSVREGRFKYVVAPYLEGKEQLFDVEADPLEQHDLLRQPVLSPVVEKMRQKLATLMQGWIREQPGLPSKYDQEYADETAERLKAMQYTYGGPEEEGD